MALKNRIISNNKTLLIFFVFFLVTVCPLLLFKYPILVDYPNHLATFYIQANIDSDLWLKENYTVKWDSIKPYILIEVLGGWLVKNIDVFIAGKIIILLGFLLTISGVLLIRRNLTGTFDLWSATALVFLYNHILFWGFLNYYVGSGLALISMGAWIRLRDISFIRQLLLFSAISTLLYFIHLFALGVYVIFVASYELGIYVYSRDKFSFATCVKAFSQFLLPFILFVTWWSSLKISAGGSGGGLSYFFGDYSTKFTALLSFASFDFSKSSLYLIVFMLISILTARIIYPRGLSIYDNLKIPLLTFFIFAMIAPASVLGVIMLDARISYIIIFLLISSIKFDESEKDALNIKKYLILMAFVSLCLKTYLISDTWRKVGRQYEEFSDALRFVSQGSKVITVQEKSSELKDAFDYEFYRHMTALSVIKRSVFWPNIFTYLTPIYPTANTKSIDSPSSPQLSIAALEDKNFKNGDRIGDGFIVYWENWLQDFDYLISIRFENLSTIDIKNLKMKYRGTFFDIYQINHQ